MGVVAVGDIYIYSDCLTLKDILHSLHILQCNHQPPLSGDDALERIKSVAVEATFLVNLVVSCLVYLLFLCENVMRES